MNNPSAGASSKTGLGTRPSTGVSHTKSASIAGTGTFTSFLSWVFLCNSLHISTWNSRKYKIL